MWSLVLGHPLEAPRPHVFAARVLGEGGGLSRDGRHWRPCRGRSQQTCARLLHGYIFLLAGREQASPIARGRDQFSRQRE